MGFDVFCIIFGLFLAAAGLICVRRERARRGSCTEAVTATVIGYEETCLKDDTGTDTWVFCPRLRYVIRDTPLEASADWGTVTPRFREGQHVRIYYDPDHPTRICVNDNSKTSGSIIACIVFGFVLTAAGVAMALFL